jgi:hypothetical protein
MSSVCVAATGLSRRLFILTGAVGATVHGGKKEHNSEEAQLWSTATHGVSSFIDAALALLFGVILREIADLWLLLLPLMLTIGRTD